jgi:hypothetical protein
MLKAEVVSSRDADGRATADEHGDRAGGHWLNCDSLSGAELESFRLPLSSRRLNTRCHQWLVRRWLVLRIMAEQTG